MLKITQEIHSSNKDHLHELVLRAPKIGDQLEVLCQLRGQILALEQVLNIKEYLIELTEDEVKSA